MPNAENICRRCAAPCGDDGPCEDCGHAAVVRHRELPSLTIAHVDCDAFFASVEKRDNPALKNKPVIVGGGKRGVVSAACYNARVYGVRSAMPMYKALKACPHAVVVRPVHGKYAKESARIKEMMRALTPLVQSVSIDEAFLDLTGTERVSGLSAAQQLVRLQSQIRSEIGVTVSVGLSFNKFLAKTASDLDKPEGFSVLGRAEAVEFLAPKPVEFIFGVGPSFARQLRKAGIVTIGDITMRSDKDMAGLFGAAGLRLSRLARAEDHRPVRAQSVRKSISAETTFFENIGPGQALDDRLWQVCQKTADRAKAKALAGQTLTLKLKTSGFRTITRRRSFQEPVQLARVIFEELLPLLRAETAEHPARQYRLIGAGLSALCAYYGDGGNLLDPNAREKAAAERASDKARERFGSSAIMTGRTFRQKSGR